MYDGHFTANQSRKRKVGSNDIYKILYELTGITVPETSPQDSRSFLEYFLSDENVKRLLKKLYTWVIFRKCVSGSV